MNKLITFTTLAAFAVRNGSDIDVPATLDKFAQCLAEYCVVAETEANTVGKAVDAVFDRFPGATMNMPAVINFTLQDPTLQVTPDNHALLTEMVGDYLRSNADRHEKKDKVSKAVICAAEAPRTRAFSIARGKGGGIRRWRDVPLTEAEQTLADASAAAEALVATDETPVEA